MSGDKEIWLIDQTCNACKKCVKECPLGAIVRVNTKPKPRYQVDPKICVVCDICQASIHCKKGSFIRTTYDQRHQHL